MNRRTFLRSSTGVAGIAIAGCTSSDGTESTPTTVSPVASGVVESAPGPFAHELAFHNRGAEPVRITLRVTRDGDTLYRRTHRVVPTSTERTLAGITEETLPEGDRTLGVEYAWADRTEGVTVTVDDCLGDVIGRVESGELDVTYSIC